MWGSCGGGGSIVWVVGSCGRMWGYVWPCGVHEGVMLDHVGVMCVIWVSKGVMWGHCVCHVRVIGGHVVMWGSFGHAVACGHAAVMRGP